MLLKTNSLVENEKKIICEKATEPPFCNKYDKLDEEGTYLCRQCGLALYRSKDKFHSGCGWPSFEEEVPHAITRQIDSDGRRTEILCSRCEAHLGHEFKGEGFTEKNSRHCINSAALDFVYDKNILDTEEAIFAAGCFWGVEYYLKKLPGVIKTEVGYTGGNQNDPSYQEVCSGKTGHFESIRVVYDPSILSYEMVAKYFFEIHDPTQSNGQGPDIGEQYLSAIFYYDENQRKKTQELIQYLINKGLAVSTRVLPVSTFWPAEEYHQNYYEKMNKQPYCHQYRKLFD